MLTPEERQTREDVREEAKKEKARLAHDAKRVFGTEEGERIFWYLLDKCEMFTDVFTGNSRTFYLEGKRAVGLELLKLRGLTKSVQETVEHLESIGRPYK
jgi:hypothetical protein